MAKILIIEDDPFLVDIYSTKFEEAGLELDVAEDGERAISWLKEKTPDLILLDIVMPNMDGFEFLRRIKEDKKLRNIPVVFLTNLGQKEEIEKGLELGAIDYIIKAHFTPGEVVEKVKKILKQ